MTDWDEIKRLAADFQRTQTIGTLSRISERNCIDIIKKLISLQKIELIYSCDGKELITPEHLLQEIEIEVHRNGGRMALHELASKLNVDYQHVEDRATLLSKTNQDYNLILGQLIHNVYKNALAKRINDSLLLEGELTIADFSKSLDLPSDYLSNILEDVLRYVDIEVVVTHGGQSVYTAEIMDKYKSIIIGTLSAILKPTTISSLVKQVSIQERILLPIMESLIKEGIIDASIENRQFIPACYARQQNEYITKFYETNSYIGYDFIARMDIKQPKAFLKKKFPDGVQLKTCLISPDLIGQVESMLEETISSNNWIDVTMIVPSVIETGDIDEILAIIFKRSKNLQTNSLIFDNTYVCSKGYVSQCKSLFSSIMAIKADDDLKSGKLVAHFMIGKIPEDLDTTKKNDSTVAQKEEMILSDDEDENNHRGRGKRNKGSGGAASQGRELKQKNVKKKYFVSTRGSKKGQESTDFNTGKKRNRVDSGPAIDNQKLIFQTPEEMKTIVERHISDDCSEDFVMSIVGMIQDDLNREYAIIARKILDEFLKEQENQKKENDEDKDTDTEQIPDELNNK